jgi:hypothetical protein
LLYICKDLELIAQGHLPNPKRCNGIILNSESSSSPLDWKKGEENKVNNVQHKVAKRKLKAKKEILKYQCFQLSLNKIMTLGLCEME